MENIWDLRKNQHCFSNASRSHPARHCWVFLCCIASFSSVSDTPKQGEAPIGCLSYYARTPAWISGCRAARLTTLYPTCGGNSCNTTGRFPERRQSAPPPGDAARKLLFISQTLSCRWHRISLRCGGCRGCRPQRLSEPWYLVIGHLVHFPRLARH